MSHRGIPLQLPQDGVVADRHAEPLHQALARTAASAVAEQADNLPDPSRPARIRRSSDRRQTVGERLSLTFLMRASPAAQQELHCHRLALDRQILEAAAGPAMPTSASPSTIGANADRGSGSGNNPTVIIVVSATPRILTPGPGDHFDFVRMPAHSDPVANGR